VATITSANCKLTFAVRGPAGIVVGPFTVEGYASDDAFAVETVESAIALMGVDGKMSAGWVPRITKQTITLQADSASRPLFEAWDGAQNVLRDVLFAEGALAYPGLLIGFALNKGVLTRLTPLPPARRVVEPVTFEISWGSIQSAPISV
jgi:hypothetical protein